MLERDENSVCFSTDQFAGAGERKMLQGIRTTHQNKNMYKTHSRFVESYANHKSRITLGSQKSARDLSKSPHRGGTET